MQELPALERAAAIIREFSVSAAESAKEVTCNGCPRKNECQKPCDAIEAQLSGPYAGKSRRERNIRIDLDDFNVAESPDSSIVSSTAKTISSRYSEINNVVRITSTDIFAQYEQCWNIFTKKQRDVLIPYYRDGKTIAEIAQDFKKSAGTVCELLGRANQRKKDYEADLLAKKMELVKKMNA